MLVETGSSEDVDETSPPLPPFFPPVPVETGGAGDEMVSFPPFPPLSVEEGMAGEVEETGGNEAVELRTSEGEVALVSFPPSVTVIWGTCQNTPDRRISMTNEFSRKPRR